MKSNYKKTDSFVELEFILEANTDKHFHQDIELLYVLNGKLEISIEDEVFLMEKDNLIIINANKTHCFHGKGDAFIACFTILYAKLSELLEQDYILFWCNSVIEHGNSYKKIKTIIQSIFNQSIAGSTSNKLFLYSLYYQLLHELAREFLITEKDMGFAPDKEIQDDRINEINQYIHLNYNRDISLHDLANKLYLSNAYLSKYITKQFGVSFTMLLNAERLNHAVYELTYTNAPITKVALDNGFANVTTFNKTFKERYNTTPSAFRQRLTKEKEDDEESLFQKQKLVKQKLESYFENFPAKSGTQDNNNQNIVVDTNCKPEIVLKNNWCKLINIGAASELLMSNIQEHLLYLKKRLHYEYVRFWDIYSKELLIDLLAENGNYNFGKLDYILDFLIANQMKPYIELGFKPKRILKTPQFALKADVQKEHFKDEVQMCNFFSAFIRHLVYRFGAEEVGTWYFEVYKEREEEYHGLEYDLRVFTEQQTDDYLETFERIAGTMRKYLPSIKIGGAGLEVESGYNKFTYILRKWKNMKEQPDFLSLNIYPYIGGIEQNRKIIKMITDDHFVINSIKNVKKLMNEVDFSVSELHVTEFNLSLSNRNTFNDHYGKGAYLMQTLMESIDQVDMLGYWFGSDIFSDYNDTNDFLFGGLGLLTKSGIPKPTFYALEMMNLLQKYLLDKGSNYIFTASGHNTWRISCHNYKKLNYNFYLASEDEIKYEDLPSMFEDNQKIKIKLKMKNLKNGIYIVKSTHINQNAGSIQDEWVRIDKEADLAEEVEYLKRIVIPQLSIKKYQVNNHTLEFEVVLEPNEIRHIYILLKQ